MNTFFKAKTVEEQIAVLAETAEEPLLASSKDARLVQHLYETYDHTAYAAQLERSLERVEQRFQAAELRERSSARNRQMRIQSRRTAHIQYAQKRDQELTPSASQPFVTILATFAAILVVTVLVASFVLTLEATRHSVPNTSVGTKAQATPISVHLSLGAFLQTSVTITQGMSIDLVNDANVTHSIADGYWSINSDNSDTPHPLSEKGMPQLYQSGIAQSTIVLDTIHQTYRLGPFDKPGTYHLYDTIHPAVTLTITVLPFGSPVVIYSSPTPPANATRVYMESQAFRTPTVIIHKGSSLLLLNDGSIEHVITNGRWENDQLVLLNEPGMPKVHSVFSPETTDLWIGPFNTIGTYYLVDSVHVGMGLTIIVK